MSSFIKDYKAMKYIKKMEKEEKKKEKENKKILDELYEKEYGKEDKDTISNKYVKAMNNFFDILWPDDDEQEEKELYEAIGEKEKQELDKLKKEEKRIGIIAAVYFTVVFVGALAGALIYGYFNRSHFEKVTKPVIVDYYKEHYGSDVFINDHKFITYKVYEEDSKSSKDKESDLLVSTLSNGSRVLTKNDEYIGDDTNNHSVVEQYSSYFDESFSSSDVVYESAKVSYKDFYFDYNYYFDFVSILPVDSTFESLKESGKLTVVDKIVYQGEVDISYIQSFLSTFSEDSMMYFIKLNAGLPSKLSIVTKDKYFEALVSNSLKIDDNILYYELDRNINSTSSITVTNVTPSGINLLNRDENVSITGGKYFKITNERGNYNEPEKPHFVLLKLTNHSFGEGFSLFNGSSSSFRELSVEDYPEFSYMTIGSETYLILEDSVGFGYKTEEKTGFMCNLGLC